NRRACEEHGSPIGICERKQPRSVPAIRGYPDGQSFLQKFVLKARAFFHLIPSSLLTSRCREKSNTAELFTGSLSFRNCASALRCSSTSLSVGMPFRVYP